MCAAKVSECDWRYSRENGPNSPPQESFEVILTK